MNRNEILNHPEINGGTKRIVSETNSVAYDSTTGELTREIREHTGYVGREPDYIKIYTDCMLVFNNMDIALSPFIVAFGRHMTYANGGNPNFRCTVRTDEMVRRDVAEYCGVSDARVKQAIKALVDAEVFIPIQINGKKKRGIYFVNPWVVGKGEWKDIKALRGQFEFVTGQAGVLAIEEDGSRKVIMPITESKAKDQLQGQFALAELTEGEDLR